MKLIIRFRHVLRVFALLSGAWHMSTAQQIRINPVQQAKLLWADTVHREAIKKKDSLLLAEAYYLYGKTYEGAGDMLTSHRWFIKSLSILEPRGASYHLSRLYNRLVAQEIIVGNYFQARKYGNLALSVAHRIRDDRAITSSMASMISIHLTDWSRGGKKPDLPPPNPDSATYYAGMRQKIMLLDRYRDSLLVNLVIEKGYKLWAARRDTSCLVYFQKALKLAIQKDEPREQFGIMLQIIKIYTILGNDKQAWNLLQKTHKFLLESAFRDSYQYQAVLQTAYTNYYVAVKDWRKAYEFAEKLYGMERNNYITDRNGAVSRLNLEYETEKKEAQLKAQQRELALNTENLTMQRGFLFALGALLILVSGAGFAFYLLYRKNQRISIRNAELVREQNHRVKNNLQVVSSLLSLQSNRLVDEQARQAVEDSQSRVETMAILHRHLYDGEGLITVDMKEFIPQVVEGVLQTYGFHLVRTIFTIAPLELSANEALPVGLIINELTTNACKYAFPEVNAPEIKVSFIREKNRIKLKVSDNGAGIGALHLDAKNTSNSFGLRLIRIQVEQLYGTYEFKNEGGTTFQMQFKPEM